MFAFDFRARATPAPASPTSGMPLGNALRSVQTRSRVPLSVLAELPTFLRLPRRRRSAMLAAVHGRSLLPQASSREHNTSTSAARAEDLYWVWHAAFGFAETSQSAPCLTFMDGSAPSHRSMAEFFECPCSVSSRHSTAAPGDD